MNALTTEFLSLRDRMLSARESGVSWVEIAGWFNDKRITRGHVYKMVTKEWEPLSPEIRIILGLPAMRPAPVCLIHGVVHDYDCQSQVVKPKPKPRAYRDLFDTPVKVLAWQLENRKEM